MLLGWTGEWADGFLLGVMKDSKISCADSYKTLNRKGRAVHFKQENCMVVRLYP